MGTNRRTVLRALGVVASGALAGCGTTETSPTNPTQTTSAPPTSTQSTVDPPARYRVHLIPGKNEELRSEIPDDRLTQYVEKYGDGVITDANILSAEPDHDYQEMEVDLLAMEYWHDNDVQNIEPDEGQAFLQTIGEDSPEGSRAHKAKNNPKATLYPNFNRETEDFGHFKYEEFRNSESVEEALDWLQRYLFSWQRLWDDPGPISTEDELYAAVLEEGVEQHTDIEIHAWEADLPKDLGDTHGNGLIYDETNNRMHVMETISSPTTQESGNLFEQYHPPIEESNYLEEGHEAQQTYWHPLRFAEDHDQEELQNHPELSFRDRKLYTHSMFANIATGGDKDIEGSSNDTIAPTTSYFTDLTNKLLNWNQGNSLDSEVFEEIKHQSKVYNLLRNHEDNFVMYGTVENPKVVHVESEDVIGEIWSDQVGEYDDFDQHLESAA